MCRSHTRRVAMIRYPCPGPLRYTCLLNAGCLLHFRSRHPFRFSTLVLDYAARFACSIVLEWSPAVVVVDSIKWPSACGSSTASSLTPTAAHGRFTLPFHGTPLRPFTNQRDDAPTLRTLQVRT